MNSLVSQVTESLKANPAGDAPDNWREWLPFFFPGRFNKPFANHHEIIWKWGWEIEASQPKESMVAILPRGGGKSTIAETLTAMVGAKKTRKYALYVRSTQDQADKSVDNIGDLLESSLFGSMYPDISKRRVGKYGQSKGWRRNRLSAANGFTVDAYGLDTALRGTKVGDIRPDFIILDDIDEKQDTIKTTKKKIEQITTSILPAGSSDVIVFAIQNLIISHGFFAKFAYNQADFLTDRILVGPIPAIENLTYQEYFDEKTKNKKYFVTGGTPTWEGQNVDVVNYQINLWGLRSFLQEAQHDVDIDEHGTYAGLEFDHVQMVKVPDLRRIVVWVDPAVSDSDEADAMGIQVDGIGHNKHIYRLYSWEDRTDPKDVIKRAILKAIEYNANEIGFETDQGGVLWRNEYYDTFEQMVRDGSIDPNIPRFPFKSAKAGAIGSKRHRHNMMRSAYDRGVFTHVIGTHYVLENALKRFPNNKPFDLADAAYWSFRSLSVGLGGWSRGMSS